MTSNFSIHPGESLAVGGSLLSIYGTLENNIAYNHTFAMQIWMFSNIILLIWAVGHVKGYWNGGLSVGSIAVMYGVFAISNFYGLFFGGLR
jgi:hypothetical protein